MLQPISTPISSAAAPVGEVGGDRGRWAEGRQSPALHGKHQRGQGKGCPSPRTGWSQASGQQGKSQTSVPLGGGVIPAFPAGPFLPDPQAHLWQRLGDECGCCSQSPRWPMIWASWFSHLCVVSSCVKSAGEEGGDGAWILSLGEKTLALALESCAPREAILGGRWGSPMGRRVERTGGLLPTQP